MNYTTLRKAIDSTSWEEQYKLVALRMVTLIEEGTPAARTELKYLRQDKDAAPRWLRLEIRRMAGWQKLCPHCEDVKPAHQFDLAGSEWHDMYTYCSPCRRERQAEKEAKEAAAAAAAAASGSWPTQPPLSERLNGRRMYNSILPEEVIDKVRALFISRGKRYTFEELDEVAGEYELELYRLDKLK